MITPPIRALDQEIGQIVMGQSTLIRIEAHTTQYGDPYKALTLADFTGALRVYAWERDDFLGDVPATAPAPVIVWLLVRQLQGQVIANLQGIRKLNASEVENAASLLTFDDCPAQAQPALAKLAKFLGGLQPDPLRGFLNRVLLDPRIAPTITTCKASQQHHHHHHAPGGLLTHSVEVMEIAADMARNRLGATELAITQVAAFLHDLGKLRAVGSGSVRPIHYLLASHETQTLRLLEPHLAWLRALAPELAAGLEYVLGFLAAPPASRGHALFLGGDIVSAADRLSAALGNHKRLEDLLARTLPGRPKRRSAPCTVSAQLVPNRSSARSQLVANVAQQGDSPWL